jgi:hypothetical protein
MLSLSVDMGLEMCFIGPKMASASGSIRIRHTIYLKKKIHTSCSRKFKKISDF